MQIGQFCETYPPTLDGVGRVMSSYCETLNDMGMQSLYIAPENPLYPEERATCETLLYRGVRVPGEHYFVGVPRLCRRYRKAVAGMHFDVLHAHSPFLAGREAYRLAKRDGAPLVATFHSKYYDDFYKATHSRLFARIGVRYVVRFYERCDEVWAVNERTAQVLRQYGYRGTIVTMPNGTNPQSVTQEQREATALRFPLRDDAATLIFAGQLNCKKNVESIVRACGLLQMQGMKLQLVLAGEGPDEHLLKNLAKEQQIDVVFTGFLKDRATLLSLYERADLMVFPSLYDNAPMVVREAAAMGTPSLLIEGSCSAEGVTHGENGYLCQNTVESIAQGIRDALPTAATVGQCAKETIPIPWKTLMERVVDRYQYLIQKKAEGSRA